MSENLGNYDYIIYRQIWSQSYAAEISLNAKHRIYTSHDYGTIHSIEDKEGSDQVAKDAKGCLPIHYWRMGTKNNIIPYSPFGEI